MATIHILTNMETDAPRSRVRIERRRLRLSTLARRCGLDPRRDAIIAQRNGRWVRQRDPANKKDWHHTLVGANDVIKFVVLPRGGNAGRTVALLAVIVVAALVAGPLGGAAALGGTLGISSATAGSLIIAGGSIVGSYAVNALLPLPQQNPIGAGASSLAVDSEAPTYAFTLSAQQNLSRLGGAKPEWFGRHRVVPDLAATAWWEWIDGKQTLYQTMYLSKGEVVVEKIELGRASIDSFEEIDYSVFGPGETADLFQPAVYQSPDVTSIPLSAPNDLVAPDDGIYGPFTIVPPSQATADFGIDISLPRGGFLQSSGGTLSPKTFQWRIEAQAIDDAGAGTGDWFTVADETFNSDPTATNTSAPESGIASTFVGGGYAATGKMNSPLTLSYRYTMPTAARYQVRCRRLDDKDLSSLAGHDLAWTGLRGFLGGDGIGGDDVYGDGTVLQIAITATASVSARSARQVAVTGTRKLPTWDSDTGEWTAAVETRSIAWAAAYVIRGENGGRLPDANFDLDTLAALDAVWSERGDYFDYYASAQVDLWEFLKTVLRSGRAVPYRQAHLVRFYRDAPQTIPWGGFSRENILQHTLKISYRTPEPEEDFDGFEIQYFDARTWNFNTLRKAFAGTDPPVRPKRMPGDGITGVDHCQRELDYLVAEYLYRPISAAFDTEMDGLYPSYGDLTLLAHDSPRWGQSNRVLDWTAADLSIDLIRPPIWTFDRTLGADNGWFVRIRDVRGRYSAQVVVVDAPSGTTIVLNNAPVYDDGSAFDFALSDSEFLHVMFGQSTDAPRAALYRTVVPREKGRTCSVQVVLDDPRVHVN
ncbi:MAG: hypothetical protein GC182_03210 [Rhodopseudomonas sp.]|nr:hypothetical protein [Rhodopseudomonas sp.]